MAMGKRDTEQQQDLFITHDKLPRAPGHVFYQKLNGLLRESGFDAHVEALCEPYYAEKQGRPSVPPGVYFRMLLVGYFEGIGSQRGIAWRCSDSLSLREFLGIPLGEESPDHSSLSYIRNRLPLAVHQQVFVWILALAEEKKLLKGKTVAVDSTTLEASAAMKSIVRKDSGEDWKDYLARLMQEQGLIGDDDERPSDEELRKFDKGRKNKRVSNEEWESPTDPDSRIAKMKDGTTHLAYKAEHVVDLDSDLILAAEIRQATEHDSHTLTDSVMQAQQHLRSLEAEQLIEEIAADKGYYSADSLEQCQTLHFRTYLPEPKRTSDWTWIDKSPEHQRAVHGNRQRVRRRKGKRLQRRRSELCERTFAHVCDSGGMRRTWLKGLIDVTKRYVIAAAAHNLGRIMRTLFGAGKPRGLPGYRGRSAAEFTPSDTHPTPWLVRLRDWLTTATTHTINAKGALVA